jgi:hypothetical protein
MPGSTPPTNTPPTRHRRDSGNSCRAKVAAAAIAVTTLLLSIVMVVDSHRIAESWGNNERNQGPPVDIDMPGTSTRATAPAGTPAPSVTRPEPAYPDPTRAAMPVQQTSPPTELPYPTTTGSPGWVGPVSPACDESSSPSPSAPVPTSSPTPVSTPNPSPVAMPVSTPDSSANCTPPATSAQATGLVPFDK